MKHVIISASLPVAVVVALLGRSELLRAQGQSLIVAPLAYYPDETTPFAVTKKVLRGTRFDAPPIIDGNFEEAIWKNCQEYGGFQLLDSSDQPKPASEKTLFRLGYDKDRLYLAVRCEESAMDRLAVSAKPQPETRDGPIENQDVVHIMLSSPHARNRQFAHICVNVAGEFVDTNMTWEPGSVGWYHRAATLEGLQVKTGRDAKGWNVELAVKFSDLGTWGANAVNLPWAFQIVRFERPHGETSSWSPSAAFPHGPDHFGILFLAQEMPLYVEHLKLFHLDQANYAVRAVIRKLGARKLGAALSVNNKPEGRVATSPAKPLSVLFLPVEIDRAKLTYALSYGQMMSKPVPYHVFAAWDKAPQIVMLAEKSFPKEETGAGMIMPGVNDRSAAARASDEADIRVLVPETEVMMAGRRALNVRFSLPFGDDFLARTKFVLRLRSTTPSRIVGEMNFTIERRSGVFAVDTASLKPGIYSIEVATRGKRKSPWQASCRVQVF